MTAVTIISDASFCPRTKAAGYGFWAVSTRGRHAGGGSFKSEVDAASTAEVMAIVNALHITLVLGIAAKGDKVLVQTDCIFAIHALSGICRNSTRKRHLAAFRAVDAFDALVRTHAVSIEFRHVRGHTSIDDRRSLAQRHADQRARQAMKVARAKKAA